MESNLNPNQPTQPNPERPAAAPESAPSPAAPEAAPQAPSGGPTDPMARPTIPQSPSQPAAPVQPPTQPGQPTSTPTGAPATASNDVDVIEKEWVAQANRIVEQTKGDPHSEEEAVEALQMDYLKKRYGHEVKKPDES